MSLSSAPAAVAKGFPFVRKLEDRVTGVLTCFDRVIFKGHLPFSYQKGLENFVDGVLRIRRMDFPRFAREQAESLVNNAQAMCKAAGVPYFFLKGKPRKEAIVDRQLRQRPCADGLVCVLCTLECCPGFRLATGQGRPQLRSDRRQQRVLYFYSVDPQLGLIYVRLQTWFPLTVQVYVNGHSWLAQQLTRRRIGFVQHDNAFTELDDIQAAQWQADRFAHLDWPHLLTRLVRRFNPRMKQPWFQGLSYYWVTDQAELSTDVIFASRSKLAEIFPTLLEVASRFTPKDILTYLGRGLHHRFDGEVMTDVKTDRIPGARIKHRMKNNWLKMYDKFGQILRVETVINNPREFRVRRRCVRHGLEMMTYAPMGKGVCNLPHYQHVASAANRRYLDALAAVDVPRVAGKDLRPLTARKVVAGRSYAGFSPLQAEDVRLFKAVLDGDHCLRGFRNTDIRERLHRPTTDANAQRRQAAALGRKLKRLHVRGLLARIPRTRRWRVTQLGQSLLQRSVHLHDHGIPATFTQAA